MLNIPFRADHTLPSIIQNIAQPSVTELRLISAFDNIIIWLSTRQNCNGSIGVALFLGGMIF